MTVSAVGLIQVVGESVTEVDDAFLSIVGYTRGEFEGGGLHWRQITTPQWRDLDGAGMHERYSQPCRMEFVRKDGTRVPVLFCCAVSPDRPLVGWMGYVVDLTNRVAEHAESVDAQRHPASVEPVEVHRRLITELVRERTARFALFDSTPSLLWAVDRELRLVIANETFHRNTSRILGHRLRVGEHVLSDHFPSALRAPWEAWYHRALSGEQFVTHSMDDSAGATTYWDHAFAPIRDRGGNVIGASVVGQDVSDRVQAEQRLARSESALTDAQRLAGVGSWEWDPATNRTHWSDELFRIYDRDPALGAPSYEELVPYLRPEDGELLAQLVTRALTTGEAYELDTYIVRRNGSRVWVTGRGEPVRSSSGAIVGLRGTSLDITRRKEVELALERSERDVRQAQRMARVGSWDWDMRTDAVSMSPVLRELLALPAEGPPPPFEQHARFYTPESWRRLADAVREAATHGVPYTIDLELSPSTQARWIVARGEPVRDDEGTIVGLQGVTVDVSDRRLAEEEKQRLERLLIQSQKMDAVGQLAGGIAHDFNNLLTALKLQVQAIHDEPALADAVTVGLRDIEGEIDRAATLTRQLLMFSRRQAMDLRPIELNQLVAGFLRMLGRLIGELVTLQFEEAKESMPLLGDSGMLEQVIMNLVVNARDAMPEGGTVTVRTRRVTVAADAVNRRPEARPGEFVEVEVTDTGKGIPPEHAERIFEPFFTTKEAGKGTGLGLATAYGIVAQHGGWIDVDSEIGVGTTVRVRLPLAMHDAAPATSQAPPSVDNAREAHIAHVLLVEDEPSLRRLLAAMLQRAGFTVETAADGPDAWQLWATNPARFDVVVSDMVLPGGMSGFDLLQRCTHANPDVRRLLMSGYSADIVAGSLKGSASVRVLSKPFSGAEFVQTLREVLNTR